MSVSRVITAGRADLDDLFEKSGLFRIKKLTQTPFLAFLEQDDNTIRVEIVTNADELLRLPEETKVMVQWRGQWRSNFFKFTVGDVSRHFSGAGQLTHSS